MEDWDFDHFDQRLMAGILGTRNRSDRPPSVNVLGAVDKVAKRLPTFRAIYDELSEYAHPNDGGTASSFARLERSGRAAVFTALGENPRRRAWTLIESVTTILLLSIDAYVELCSSMPELARISDVEASAA